ncbi:MAG: lanthionine synthetase LanC family protein [Eubacteriales bacterium]|nr:lanthionine synthetase LanC family protein [Eubacteriales bacterium]
MKRNYLFKEYDAEDFSDYPMLTEKALYGGSAGIGLFYLRLYQATGKKEYLSEAVEAAEDITATDEGTSFYENTLNHAKGTEDKLVHVKNMPGWIIGYYNGPTGSAYLHIKLYEITGDKKYKDYAVKVADDLLKAAKRTEEGIHWSEQNDLCGDAGFVTFLLAVWEMTKDETYRNAAAEIGNYVVSKGKAAPNGGKYWNVVDLTIIDFPKDVFWVNFAHGTSGVGWIFALLYQATKQEKFLEAAKDAAAYIEGIAVGDQDAALVPYLDSLERGPSTEFYYLSMCHGPAGTALLFEALYKITGDDHYLEWVTKLSRGIIKAGAPEHYSRGYWSSQALCCGTPGLLEHFISVYKLTEDPEFLKYAGRTARAIIGQSHVDDDAKDIYRPGNTRRWLGNWWRTIPQDVHTYSGLYIGTAGNAWALLSLAGLLKEEDYIQLVEYND